MLFSEITVKHERICRANDLGSGKLRRRLNDLYKLQYLERSHISLSWFSRGFSVLVELEFLNVRFCGGRKTGEPGENPRSKARTNNKLNPQMHRAGIEPTPH